MITPGVRKEVGIHSADSAQAAPLARLRARFGSPLPAPTTQTLPPGDAPRAVSAEPPPALSLLDLPPDLFEDWQERACIRHYDGKLPWKEAEALALADLLPRAGSVGSVENVIPPGGDPYLPPPASG